MYSYSRLAATAMIALGLGIAACSPAADTDTAGTATSAISSETTSVLPGMHSPTSAEGVSLTVDAAYTTEAVDMHSENGAFDGIAPEASREDGIFVVVETTIKNEGGTDMDLTCAATGAHVYAEVATDQDAVYQPVQGLHRIPTNPECNHNLGSGFDAPLTWVFQIPTDASAQRFGFAHSELGAGELTWISLDKLTAATPTTGTVIPQEAGEVPAEAGRAVGKSVPTQEPTRQSVVPPQVTDPPVAPAPAPTLAPVPAAPAYGAACPVSLVQQPGQAADGSPLVCIYAGTDSPVWVYGPEPSGAGTASPGGACEGYEAGGQDTAGRMMMCSGGQWVYGP